MVQLEFYKMTKRSLFVCLLMLLLCNSTFSFAQTGYLFGGNVVNNVPMSEHALFKQQRIDYYYSAFKNGWSVRMGVGYPSFIHTNRFINGKDRLYYDIIKVPSLDEYFADYNGVTLATCAFSVGADYHISYWFSVSMDLSMDWHWHNIHSGINNSVISTKKGTSITLIPQAKFFYVNRPWFRFYSTIGFGMSVFAGYDKGGVTNSKSSLTQVSDPFGVAFQVTPIGMEIGKEFFGYIESGAGSLFTGLRGGFGYRF